LVHLLTIKLNAGLKPRDYEVSNNASAST